MNQALIHLVNAIFLHNDSLIFGVTLILIRTQNSVNDQPQTGADQLRRYERRRIQWADARK